MNPAILEAVMRLQFQPMPLLKRAAPFDDPNWIYELKMDGFRALAIVENGRAQLISRNGHPFVSFSALAESIYEWRSAQRMWRHGVDGAATLQ